MIIQELINNKLFELAGFHRRIEELKRKPKWLSGWFSKDLLFVSYNAKRLERELGQLNSLKECLNKSEIAMKHPEAISWTESEMIKLGFSIISVEKVGEEVVHRYVLNK